MLPLLFLLISVGIPFLGEAVKEKITDAVAVMDARVDVFQPPYQFVFILTWGKWVQVEEPVEVENDIKHGLFGFLEGSSGVKVEKDIDQ